MVGFSAIPLMEGFPSVEDKSWSLEGELEAIEGCMCEGFQVLKTLPMTANVSLAS